jgi:hypothetical protein
VDATTDFRHHAGGYGGGFFSGDYSVPFALYLFFIWWLYEEKKLAKTSATNKSEPAINK